MLLLAAWQACQSTLMPHLPLPALLHQVFDFVQHYRKLPNAKAAADAQTKLQHHRRLTARQRRAAGLGLDSKAGLNGAAADDDDADDDEDEAAGGGDAGAGTNAAGAAANGAGAGPSGAANGAAVDSDSDDGIEILQEKTLDEILLVRGAG